MTYNARGETMHTYKLHNKANSDFFFGFVFKNDLFMNGSLSGEMPAGSPV
jgi:hypothetical protein